jgi:hypothetical protein
MYQGLKLLGIQLHFAALPNARPMESTLVQSTCRQVSKEGGAGSSAMGWPGAESQR